MWGNFWDLRVNDRLTRWKLFRSELSELPLEEALELLNNTWDKAPYVDHYLDEDASDWPDPWTLIAENYYCDLAKALGKIYTLYFAGHKDLAMSLEVYYNSKTRERYYVVNVMSGRYMLNLWPNEVVSKKEVKQLKLIHSFSKTDLKLEKF